MDDDQVRVMRDQPEREGHGFRKIGDLVPKIMPGPPSNTASNATAPTASPSNSSIIGQISQGRGVARFRGGVHGAIESGPLPSVSHALMGDRPEATDKALLASLTPCVVSSLRELRREWVDPQYGYDFEITGYVLADAVPDDDIKRARGILGAGCRPADDATIKAELTRLRVTTKAARIDDRDDYLLGMTAYADAMAEYPPDIVRAVCRGWARREKWFPSLAELIAELDRGARARFGMARALG